MTTFFANKIDVKEGAWHIVDAKGQILGRLSSQVARVLMGKTSPGYTPHVDAGNGVIVINAADIAVTGTKVKTKMYRSYSGYPGGYKERPFESVMKQDPAIVIKHAVKGMLPKTRLGKRMITRLLVYPGSDHPHSAQKPKPLSLKEKN
jgi:large subunit ribosomal protein L13